MKTLICTVGLPRSGKTTWARAQGYPIVNPDSVRLALHGERFIGVAEPFVWAITFLMVRALFLVGHETIIVDATNTTFKRQEPWIKQFHTEECKVCFHVIKTSKEICLKRALDTNDNVIIPVIERMAEQYEIDSIKDYLFQEKV